MQLIPEGPNIPDALLNAHAEGKVVFFCGAGVSVDAGYPLFPGLVSELRDLNPISDTPELDEAIGKHEYDFALSILQNVLGKRNPKLRRDTAQILSRRPKTLDNHRTILRLSRQRDGTCRLVTTNFDRLFVKAANGQGKIGFDGAPKLPVPRPDRWNSVVHLHGLLPKNPDDTELGNLILSSADFGEAYVTESYCSRFVVELLRHYTIVLIGYSLDDRIMRYLLDAISFSERQLGEDNHDSHFHKPYAFVEHNENDKKEAMGRWEHKEAIPIPYFVEEAERKRRGSHHRLYKTLDAWAELASGGQHARVTLALNEAQKPFLAEDTFTQERLLWALKDDDGKAAEALANTTSEAETFIDWLPFFAANGLLDQVYSPEEWQKVLANRQRAISQETSPTYQGSITNGSTGLRLKPVTKHLIEWMQWHLDKIELADWFLKNGGIPHTDFSWAYNHPRNKKKEIVLKNPEQRVLWDILTSDAFRRSHSPTSYWFDLRESFNLKNAMDATEFLSHVKLKLDIRPSVFRDFEGSAETFLDKFEFELKFTNPQMDYQIEQIIAHADRQDGLEGLCEPLTQAIATGLNWLALVKKASSKQDLTGYSIPSISDHEQNSYIHEFGRLVFLLRASFDKLSAINPNAALKNAQQWSELDFPLFKRLFLYAANRFGGGLDRLGLQILTSNNSEWLWALDTTREVNVYLRERVKDWRPSEVAKLCNAVLKGPDRNKFREISNTEWVDIRDRMVRKHLKKLEQGGVPLPSKAITKLTKLSAKFPFALPDDHSDEFVVYSGSVRDVEWDEDIEPFDYKGFLEKSAIERVASWDKKHFRFFRKLADERPAEALEMLEVGLAQNLLDPIFWREGISGLGRAMELSINNAEAGDEND